MPGGQKIGLVALTSGMIGAYAHEVGCAPMDLGFAPEPPPEGKGCQEVDGGGQLWRYIPDNGQESRVDAGYPPAKKIITTEYSAGDPSQGMSGLSAVYWEDGDGNMQSSRVGLEAGFAEPYYYIIPNPGSECVRDDHTDLPPVPDVPAETYIDQSTNCSYTVKLVGALQELPGSDAQLVYQIESTEQARAGGGRIGGCFLSPHIYVHRPQGPNGPNGPNGPWPPIPPIPVPPNPPGPDDGLPWWAVPLLAAATAAGINLIGDALEKLSEPGFLEGEFTMTAPCDVDDQGNPESRTWEFLEGSFPERMNAQQVAIMEMLQQHLNWKTPICGSEKPKLEGTWISTRWISDGNSPGGERPLRKLFRYRSKSSLTDEQLRDYWADFSWQAGPVCVKHSGAWWGYPQVWASTPEEGK